MRPRVERNAETAVYAVRRAGTGTNREHYIRFAGGSKLAFTPRGRGAQLAQVQSDSEDRPGPGRL
jgi:hypothetical protein